MGVLWMIDNVITLDHNCHSGVLSRLKAPLEDHALALARWKDQKQGSRTSDNTWHFQMQRAENAEKPGNDRKVEYTGKKVRTFMLGRNLDKIQPLTEHNKKRTQGITD